VANNPNPNSGGKPPSVKDRLFQIEANLSTILENEKTLYDEMMKLKGAMEKIATVVDQHSQVLTQLMGGGAQATQAVPSPSTPMQAPPPAPRGHDDLSAALSIIGPVLEYLGRGKSDPVTNQLVSAALQSAVQTLQAGPLLVQAVASALGGSFGKTYGREAGHQLAKNLSRIVETTGQVVAEAPQVEGEQNAVLEK